MPPCRDSGVNTFSRYENGETKPPLALVKLLSVLDRRPELIDEIKAAQRKQAGQRREQEPSGS